jgi:hypothetical protein
MYPIGKTENVQKALVELSADAARGAYLKISPVTLRMARELTNFSLTSIRYQFDYVYKREKLASMSGKKLHKKRNHLNYFENNFTFKMIDLTDDKLEETYEFLKSLILERSFNPNEELLATLRVVNQRNRLGLISKLLYADERLVGVIIAQNHFGTALIHIAKADVDTRGASVALFSYFLRDNLTECDYVNFMEDMGIEGLRQMKESYYPEFMIEKFVATRPLVKTARTARIVDPILEHCVKINE